MTIIWILLFIFIIVVYSIFFEYFIKMIKSSIINDFSLNTKIVAAREIVANFFYAIPFLLGFFAISAPYNIGIICLMIIHRKITDETDQYQDTAKLNFLIKKLISNKEDPEYKEIEEVFSLDVLEDTPLPVAFVKIFTGVTFSLIRDIIIIAFTFVSIYQNRIILINIFGQ